MFSIAVLLSMISSRSRVLFILLSEVSGLCVSNTSSSNDFKLGGGCVGG